jgi:predicted RND superfamily exporter protein
MKELFEKQEMTSLAMCMNTMQRRGYKENFLVDEQGLFSADSGKHYLPRDARIVDYYRFEGETDPADSSILYVIETQDGAKGLLSDSYGAYAEPKVSRFMEELEVSEKKRSKAI